MFNNLRKHRGKGDQNKLSVTTDASAQSLSKSAAGRVRAAQNYDEELDPGMARVKEEAGSEDSDEDDEDFEGGSTSESSESGSDIAKEASDSEDEGQSLAYI